jgi:hypothetical protein
MKTGKVKTVSKFGGVILDGEEGWINPSKELKETINYGKEIEGKEVELTMVDNNHFSSLRIISQQSTIPAKSYVASSMMQNDVQRRISRHGSLNTAIELIKCKIQNGDKIDDVEKEMVALARRVLTWVEKED